MVVGGNFWTAGGQSAFHLAYWDGQQWSAFGDPNGSVEALAMRPNGEILAGGDFRHIGGVTAPYLARWGCPNSFCYADCDESGELDFFDFLCFQFFFAAGDPRADCDEDGAYTFFDLLCFQNLFAAGCP